jgi:hypothetical protein
MILVIIIFIQPESQPVYFILFRLVDSTGLINYQNSRKIKMNELIEEMNKRLRNHQKRGQLEIHKKGNTWFLFFEHKTVLFSNNEDEFYSYLWGINRAVKSLFPFFIE